MTYDWTDLQVIERYAALEDIYGPLLTERQQEILALFFSEDWTIQEIADYLNISRQAVHEQLVKACGLLDQYEASLSLYERWQKVLQGLSQLAHDTEDQKTRAGLEQTIRAIQDFRL